MRIAIYPNVTKSGAGEILERVIKFANQYNIELLLPPKEGKFFYHEELINQNIEKEYIDNVALKVYNQNKEIDDNTIKEFKEDIQ